MVPRMRQLLCILALVINVFATPNDVISHAGDVISRDIFPGIGEYIYVQNVVNWTRAEVNCRASASHLITIDSEEEEAVVKSLLAKYEVSFIHIGFHDAWLEGEYTTVFGDRLSSSCNSTNKWAPGNPKGGSNYNCGAFSRDGYSDIACGQYYVYMCERTRPGQLPDYTLVPGYGYYKLFTEPVQWAVAQDTCRQEGTHLVVLNSEEEVEALRVSFNIEYPFGFHVGIQRFIGDNQVFQTMQGTPLSSTGFSRWFNDDIEPFGTFITHPFTQYFASDASSSGLKTSPTDLLQQFICERALF